MIVLFLTLITTKVPIFEQNTIPDSLRVTCHVVSEGFTNIIRTIPEDIPDNTLQTPMYTGACSASFTYVIYVNRLFLRHIRPFVNHAVMLDKENASV